MAVTIQDIAKHYLTEGEYKDAKQYGSGHINDTYLVSFDSENDNFKNIIIQRINKTVFPNPEEVMENVVNVTHYLKEKIIVNHGDFMRETINVIKTIDGKNYYIDEDGEYWRAYVVIEGATCYDSVDNPEIFYESAKAFGKFQSFLSDFPVDTLHETIKGFHNTKQRFQKFVEAVNEDVVGRVANVQKEIEFVLEREYLADVFNEPQEKRQLPIRVTHNDTKLNNVLIDNKTGKGLCVLDLDTVMPGLTAYDFGDAIRFGASTAAEDEKDLDKVQCDMELFKTYTQGFIDGCDGKLTDAELKSLAMGAKVMTYECGMRFLMDYLQGDIYFKIHRDGQNLDRARTQLKLVADMEKKWDTMCSTVSDIAGGRL